VRERWKHNRIIIEYSSRNCHVINTIVVREEREEGRTTRVSFTFAFVRDVDGYVRGTVHGAYHCAHVIASGLSIMIHRVGKEET